MRIVSLAAALSILGVGCVGEEPEVGDVALVEAELSKADANGDYAICIATFTSLCCSQSGGHYSEDRLGFNYCTGQDWILYSACLARNCPAPISPVAGKTQLSTQSVLDTDFASGSAANHRATP